MYLFYITCIVYDYNYKYLVFVYHIYYMYYKLSSCKKIIKFKKINSNI